MEVGGGLAMLLLVGITGMDAGMEDAGKEEESAAMGARPG